jgi:glutaminyl-tRNA synthetase
MNAFIIFAQTKNKHGATPTFYRAPSLKKILNLNYSKDQLHVFVFLPNLMAFLHIGHVKAICLNFNLGERYEAPVNLRFDDTNPAKEEQQFVDAIKENIQWLGYQWDSKNVMHQIISTSFTNGQLN